MRFTFDEDQLEFQRVLRDFLSQACTPDDIRAGRPEPNGRPSERWRQLAELGAVGLAVPEAAGGMGMDDVSLILPLEEAGRAVLPEPLGAVAAVSVPLLRELGVGGDWLDGIAAGDVIPVAGLAESEPIVAADQATVLLLVDGTDVHALEPAQVGLHRCETIDAGRHRFRVEWTPTPASRIAGGSGTEVALAAARDRAAVAASAELLGVTAQLIDMASDYARVRQQFGRPIGAFQAVKHMLADALVALAFARPVVYRAAASLADAAPTRARDASMAKAVASETALSVARTALQIHGAIGYTSEHDLILWFNRAHALALWGGDAAWHRARVADSVLAAA